jgi:hypothetical protein
MISWQTMQKVEFREAEQANHLMFELAEKKQAL